MRFRRRAAGLTQRELAERSGVKQSLISAIERGVRHPTDTVRRALDSALDLRPSVLLGAARDQVLATIRGAGGRNVRVFGSVARGDDVPGSDVDLAVAFPPEADIVTLLAVEEELSELLTVPVDIISVGGPGRLPERVLAGAVPL